jgi:hypothetical protein
LPLLRGIKATVKVVKAKVEVLNIELVSSRGVELGVNTRLSGSIDYIDVWALIA